MTPESYKYYFAYSGSGRFFQPLKTQIASDKVGNIAWTVPCLIGGGLYLQRTMGGMRTTKFFGLSLLASYLFICAGGPNTQIHGLHLRSVYPAWLSNFLCIDDEKHTYMGSDLMAASCAYLAIA